MERLRREARCSACQHSLLALQRGRNGTRQLSSFWVECEPCAFDSLAKGYLGPLLQHIEMPTAFDLLLPHQPWMDCRREA